MPVPLGCFVCLGVALLLNLLLYLDYNLTWVGLLDLLILLLHNDGLDGRNRFYWLQLHRYLRLSKADVWFEVVEEWLELWMFKNFGAGLDGDSLSIIERHIDAADRVITRKEERYKAYDY